MNQIEPRNHPVKCHYGIKDYWNYYNNHYNTNNSVTEELYKKVLIDFLENIRDEISLEGKNYKFPMNCGSIELLKSKPQSRITEDGKITGLPINYKETMKLRKETGDSTRKVFYFNDHSDGFVIKICYRKFRAKYKYKSIYALRPNRLLKRTLRNSVVNKTIDISFIPLIYSKTYE